MHLHHREGNAAHPAIHRYTGPEFQEGVSLTYMDEVGAVVLRKLAGLGVLRDLFKAARGRLAAAHVCPLQMHCTIDVWYQLCRLSR